jgi:hypothetical protein
VASSILGIALNLTIALFPTPALSRIKTLATDIQEVRLLEVVHVVEEPAEFALLLLLGEHSGINLFSLERLDLVVVFVKAKRFAFMLAGLHRIVGVEDRAFEHEAETGDLGDGVFGGGERVGHGLVDVAATADEQGDHADHFADLVHHETLAVDFKGQPFGLFFFRAIAD